MDSKNKDEMVRALIENGKLKEGKLKLMAREIGELKEVKIVSFSSFH